MTKPKLPTGSDPAPRTLRRANHILDNAYIGPARDPQVEQITRNILDRFKD
ncbi:MAG: hypothetical protein AAGI06_00320 [Pseudomonadota bacterium]